MCAVASRQKFSKTNQQTGTEEADGEPLELGTPPARYNLVARDRKCGAWVAHWYTEQPTLEACATQCTARKECVSFSHYTATNQRYRLAPGVCKLHSEFCGTHSAKYGAQWGTRNEVYNKVPVDGWYGVNLGFEADTVPNYAPAADFLLAGWSGNSWVLVESGNDQFGAFNASEGINFVALQGTGSYVEQEVNLVPGELSFQWNRPRRHFPSLTVFLGDEVVYYNHFEKTSDPNINMDHSWRTASVVIDDEMIEVLGTTVKMRFQNDIAGKHHMFIDNIRFTEETASD